MSLVNMAIGFDQFVNTLAGGTPDETLSARCYRLAVIKTPQSMIALKAQKMIDAIFFWQDEHCKQAFVSEVERKQLPSVYAQYTTTVKKDKDHD